MEQAASVQAAADRLREDFGFLDDWRDKVEHEHHAFAEMLESLDAAGERARNARRG